MNRAMRMPPSQRLRPLVPMWKRVYSRPRAMRSTVIRMFIGMSRFQLDGVMAIGRMRAVTPRISRVFMMFEPTTLPMAMSALPWKAPMKLTTISGAEVPMPTMVRPMTNSLRPKRRAMPEAPSTSQSAPNTMRARPPMSRRTCNQIISLSV